jgi:uncharacterized protein (DUF983 family)
MKRCPHCKARTLPFVAVLRSTDRRPLRCSACGEFAFLPSAATFPLLFLFELAVCIGVLAALILSGATLLVAALASAGALGLGIAALWPLSRVSPRSGAISLTHPSRFYSGNP